MKSFALLLIMVLSNQQFSHAADDPIPGSKKMGLVAYLTTVKGMAEMKSLSLQNQTALFVKEIDRQIAAKPAAEVLTSLNKSKAERLKKLSEFTAGYLIIKTVVERFVNQLSADMYAKNNLRAYKKLNRFLRSEKEGKKITGKYASYEPEFETIEDLLLAYELRTFSSMLGGPGLGDIVGAVELVHTMFSEARAFRQTKVAAMSKLLESCKLKDVIGEKIEDKEKE
jgi:hypothetical protein